MQVISYIWLGKSWTIQHTRTGNVIVSYKDNESCLLFMGTKGRNQQML